MNQTNPLPIFRQRLPDAAIWDGASAHGGKAIGQVGFVPIALPPHSPELNPCERVLDWLRGHIEGEVYASFYHKRLMIDQLLRQWNADKGLLNSLIGWQWIQATFAQVGDA